jgi:hypothetical protein
MRLVGPDGYEYSLEELNNLQATEKPWYQKILPSGGASQLDSSNYSRSEALAQTYGTYSQINPDQEAQDRQTAQTLGLPQSIVNATPEVRKEAISQAQSQNNAPQDWGKFTADNPYTSKYLSDPQYMAIAHDDINNLAEHESILTTMGKSVRLRELEQQRGEIGNTLFLSGSKVEDLSDLEKERLSRIDEEIKQLQPQIPTSTWSARGLASAIAGFAPSLKTAARYSYAGAAAGAATGLLGGPAAEVTVPAAMLAGAGAGFKTGFNLDLAATASGNRYLDEVQKNVAPLNAALGSAVTGAATYGLSYAQVGKWMKIPESTGLKQIGLTAAEQALIGAGFTGADIAGQKIAEKDWSIKQEDLQAMVEGGINMIPIGLALSVPGHAVSGLSRLSQIAEESKTRQRSPEAYAEFVNSQAGEVSISGLELATYLETQKPEQARAIAERLKINDNDLAEAITTGGEVKVGLGNFLTIDKQHQEALLQDVRVGDHPTEREIQQYKEELKQVAESQQKTTEPAHPEQRGSIAEELGLSETTQKAKAEQERIIAERENAEKDISIKQKIDSAIKEAQKEVEAKVASEPLYRAMDSIDVQLFSKLKNGVKEIAQKYTEGKLTEKQKVHFEIVAESHGFTSGDELAKRIKGSRVKSDEVKTRLNYMAEQMKREELGDKKTVTDQAEFNAVKLESVSHEAAALRGMARGEHIKIAREKDVADAVSKFKDAEAALLVEIQKAKGDAKIQELKNKLEELKRSHADELKQLKKEQKTQQEHDSKLAKEWLKSEDVSQRIGRQAQIGIKAALEYAREVIAGKPISEAIAYGKYMSQARNAARLAEKAYRAGKYEEAARYKNQEMVNHALVLEAVKVKKEFDQINGYLKEQQKSDIKTWKKEEHFNQAADLLTRFGYDRSPINKMETLDQWAQRMSDKMDTVSIADWLLSDTTSNPQKLTLQQLTDVKNAIANIKHIAQTEDKFFRLFDNAAMNEKINEAKTLLADKPDVYTPEVGFDERSIKAGYFYSLKKVTSFLWGLDGKDFGFFYKLIYEKPYDAQNALGRRMSKLKEMLDSAYSAYSKKERAKLGSEKVFYDELGVSITKEQLIQIALNAGNKSSKDVLFSKAPVGLEKSALWRGTPEQNEIAIMKFLGENLDKRDWGFIQNTWGAVNSLFPDADARHKEMSGFSMEKIDAVPFNVTLADGSTIALRGGYYPLKQDPRSLRVAEVTGEEPLYTGKAANMFIGTDKGYTYSRTGATYPIKLTSDTTFQHLSEVAHDIEFRPVITDLRRLILNKDFADLIKQKTGLEGYALLKEFISSSANSRTEASRLASDWMDKSAEYLRNRVVVAQLMGRLGVVLQNFANPLLYGKAVEGFSHTDAAIAFFKRGIFDYWPKLVTGNAGKIRDFVLNNSQFMKDKTKTPDWILHEVKKEDSPIVEFFTMLLAESDNLTNFPMWMEAYEKKINTGATHHDAVMYADILIDRATGSGRKIDTPQILRTPGVKRTLAMYKTFMLTQYNTWAIERQIFLKDKDVMRVVTQVAAKWWLFTLGSALFSGKINFNDDPEKILKNMVAEIISYPLGFLPVLGDMGQVVVRQMAGIKSFNYRVTPLESAAYDVIDVFSTTKKAIKGDKDIADVLESASKVTAYKYKYPDQFNDWFWNAYDMLVNDMEFKAEDIMKRRPKKERN